MTKINLIIMGLLILLAFLIIFILLKITKRPKKLKTAKFVVKWRDVQKYCKERTDWPVAIKEADKLLDFVLKKKHFKGKTMGARLMAAQRQIKDNDGIWEAHKLAKKIAETKNTDKNVKLSKIDVKESLQSYQDALIDLGALRRRG